MLENEQIILFGEEWGQRNVLSKQRYAAMLAESNDVIYGNGLPHRPPRFNLNDFRKIARRLKSRPPAPAANQPSRVRIHSPKIAPLFGIPPAMAWNRRWLRSQVKGWMAEAHFDSPILWLGAASGALLIGQLNEKCLIYHLTDDYILQDGVNTKALRPLDEKLAREADLVFVTSETLLERKSRFNENCHLIDHGVDFDLFCKPQTPCPPELENLPRPIIGYHGYLDERFDRRLMMEAARLRPDWSFVAVGDALLDFGDWESLPNVYRVGFRPMESIGDYVSHFDLGVVPYRVYERTKDGNPLKVKEYLAAGRPVLAPDIPCMKMYDDLVHIFREPADFVLSAEQALAESGREWTERRRDFARRFSWRANLEFMSERIQDVLKRR